VVILKERYVYSFLNGEIEVVKDHLTFVYAMFSLIKPNQNISNIERAKKIGRL